MRLGTAARHWAKLAPSESEYREFRDVLARAARVLVPPLELCYVPWSVEDGLRAALVEPPATLLVLPNGWVKVAAALPGICADLRRTSIVQAWQAYREAWRNEATRAALQRAIGDESSHAHANDWQWTPLVHV